jgi:predicted TIM-barrel fold metal-dependent hydrolase
MIIDAHAHVFPQAVRERRAQLLAGEPAFAEIYGDPVAKMATAGELLHSMDEAGVERTVICNFAWHDEALIDETNEYILGAAAAANGRLIPFVSVSLSGAGRHGGVDVEESVGAQKADPRKKIRQLSIDGARGIGELRPAAGGYNLANSDEADLLNWAASAFDLPLLVHVSEPVGHAYPGKAGGASVEDVYEFARAAAGVTVIAAHWGGGLPFYALMPEVRQALDNVYVDTAASHLLYDDAVYHQAIEVLGAKKILWGSDFPLTSQRNALDRTRAAELDDDALSAILGGNAQELFRI